VTYCWVCPKCERRTETKTNDVAPRCRAHRDPPVMMWRDWRAEAANFKRVNP
jgi:hypothetical protein